MGQLFVMYGKSKGRRLPRRRLWVEPGRAMAIGADLVLSLMVDRVGSERRVYAQVTSSQEVGYSGVIAPGDVLDLSCWAGLMMVPMAIEITGEYAKRLLVEFIAVREDVKFAPH